MWVVPFNRFAGFFAYLRRMSHAALQGQIAAAILHCELCSHRSFWGVFDLKAAERIQFEGMGHETVLIVEDGPIALRCLPA